jgi:thiamine pyrophosphate-dependent acetolactate synthase large subunit-like protein
MDGRKMSDAKKLNRRDVVKTLTNACSDALVIAGLGSSAYDLFAAGDRDLNFYLWGAMGGAASIGLGLALAQPDKSVVVLTGDGEQLMGLGSLATIGAQKPNNLTIVVLDNGHYGETGMQPSHTSLGTNLSAVATACGLAWVMDISETIKLSVLAERINSKQACGLASICVSADELPRALPNRDAVFLKNRFRAALGLKIM